MSSKLAYCPWEEAWSLNKPLDNNMDPESSQMEIGGGYQLENPRPTPLSPKQLEDNRMESDFATFIQNKTDPEEVSKLNAKELVTKNEKDICLMFAKHIEECADCREKMSQRFGQKMMENFQNINQSNYFEILMIILIGVIIIVIMDSFLRLGKMLKK